MAKGKRKAKKATHEADSSKQLHFDEPIHSEQPAVEGGEPPQEEVAVAEVPSSEVIEPSLEVSETSESPEVAEVSEQVEESGISPEVEAPTPEESENSKKAAASVKAETHSKKRTKNKSTAAKHRLHKKWPQLLGFSIGILALITMITSGFLSQYFKGKAMPNVVVASVSSTAKTQQQLKDQLQNQVKSLTVTFALNEKTFKPKLEEIGVKVDIDKTVENALHAKRKHGLLGRLSFWHRENVPAVVTVNDTLLAQYLEKNAPELSKPPKDAQLQFNAETGEFSITEQADGEGADSARLKKELLAVSNDLSSKKLVITTATKGPTITQEKLEPLVAPANAIVSRRIVLTGLGYTYQARPTDIASWVTPTPKESGEVKLVIDPAKIQSYVDGIGKRISNTPVDKKVLRDETTGAEVVLQDGRDGTELADKQVLADAIAKALKDGQDTTQEMNIKVAQYQTVNMNAYEKWIEVDLSEQRTTAYERATPVKNFLIASGMRGHETVKGEFAIWYKVRSQTMQGGSKADGSYYSIPNVEWVSYFYQDYALHGAWWREKFGYPASHGCVNMTNTDAQWVYEWAPIGTKVIVHA